MNISVTITRSENAEYFSAQVGEIVFVPFEAYVAAVVASEIGNSHIEACKAQAIAARTFAVSRGVLKGRPISDSSATAQAYRAKRYDPKSYPNALSGAKETEGLILVYGGKSITAVFSASNGGRIVSSQERWGSALPYLLGKNDPWDAAFGKPKNGHGVGMSQNGAKWAADHGIDHEEILAFYYPGTEIVNDYGEVIAINSKAQAVVDLANEKIGDPYVYGASGHQCTPEIRRRYAGYNPEHKSDIYNACPVLSGKQQSCAGCKWRGHLCYDCRGFTAYVLRTAAGITINGGGATTQYGTASNWDARGTTDQMPDVVCCLFKRKGNKMSHTGLHVGGGKIIHCSTVVKAGSTGDRSWTHYAVPKGLYTANEIKETGAVTLRGTLRNGAMGDDVRKLQLDLYSIGYDTLVIDGIFGKKTEAAVRDFQSEKGLAVDGIVGPKTWAAIDDRLQELGRVDRVTSDQELEKAESEKPAENGYVPKGEDSEITLPNKPVELTYPGGQTIKMRPEVAEDLIMRLQEQLVAGGAQVEIVAPVGLVVTVTAVGAVNIWQQIREVSL